jgi:hypothetical protein
VGLQAGWYPQDDGRERYWDGERWTDDFRGELATEQMPAPPKREEGAWEQKGRLLLILLGVVAFVWLAATKCGGPSTSGPDEYNVQAMCKELVRDRLKNPSTADFSDEQQSVTTASGTVVAENALGGKVTHTYRCVASGDTVTLVNLMER